jgi:hypothetical protein
MRDYERRRADQIRAHLLIALGNRCALCGSKRHLEFNHLFRRAWSPNRFNRYQRLLRYRRESDLGLINLLCRSCNASFRPLPITDSHVPF